MPGRIDVNASRGRIFYSLITLGLALVGFLGSMRQSGELLIGQIQGREDASPFLDHQVGFRGIVTGIREDQNAAGIRYYTFFVQSVDGASDGDPLTSDGIAVFTGRSRPRTRIGDLVEVWGVVTEFYGLTEIDDNGLYYQVDSNHNPLPVPVELDPPEGFSDSGGYYEPLEGMRVEAPYAVTVGPTHSACGFSVVREDLDSHRIMKHSQEDSRGDVIKVLYFSDVNCDNLPALATGDRIDGIVGPLTYHFDQYKVVIQASAELHISNYDHPPSPRPHDLLPGQFSIASFNLENYFDAIDDTGGSAEPKPSLLEIEIKQIKLAHTIANTLACPTIIGVQEVEKYELLSELALRLTENCGFTYEVSYLDTADARGTDLALLSNPRRIVIRDVDQYQTCSQIETEIHDSAVSCADGQEPLFARQPLIVDLEVDRLPLTVIVNHFKSKRGGEAETEPWRITQSQELHRLIRQLLADQSDRALVILGDYNDFDRSPVRKALNESDILVDTLSSIPEDERYSYIFDGESQLTDWVLMSPKLSEKIVDSRIAHVNADYPYQLKMATVPELIAYRSSDHDIPIVTLDLEPKEEPQAGATTQDLEEASRAEIGSLSTTPQPVPPDMKSAADGEENLGLSDEEAVNKNGETIESARNSAEDSIQKVAFVDQLERLSKIGLILLAIASFCVLVVLVIFVFKGRD